MKVINKIHTYSFALLSTAAVLSPTFINGQSKNKIYQQATYEKVVSPKGSSSAQILASAPSPKLTVQGQMVNAKFVIDISKNILYNYDENGKAKTAYSIASGRIGNKGKSLTPTGIRRISHVEKSPYTNVPCTAKRYNNPGGVYGPWFIYTTQFNPNTGAISHDGIGVHGNADEKSLGKHASKGCIRMDNAVITQLAQEVKRGQYIIVMQ